eukprot:1138789-Pelagomonas_calceolata.AAC.1
MVACNKLLGCVGTPHAHAGEAQAAPPPPPQPRSSARHPPAVLSPSGALHSPRGTNTALPQQQEQQHQYTCMQ